MGATPKIPTVTELPPWSSTTLLSFLVCCDCLLCVASSERHEPQRQPDSTYLRSCFPRPSRPWTSFLVSC